MHNLQEITAKRLKKTSEVSREYVLYKVKEGGREIQQSQS